MVSFLELRFERPYLLKLFYFYAPMKLFTLLELVLSFICGVNSVALQAPIAVFCFVISVDFMRGK
jgi:hypothetical protein